MKSKRVHKIKKKLNHEVTWQELYDFEKLFPPINSRFSIPIRTKIELDQNRFLYCLRLSSLSPYVDFWKRWKRFQNLKAFL